MDDFDPQDRLIDALLSELAGDRPSPGLRERTLARAFPALAAPAGPKRRRVWLALAGAAVAAGLLAGVGTVYLRPRNPAPARIAPPLAPPEAPQAERVQLADGCRIEPMGDAAYCVVAPRRVLLDRGQLYVEVDRRAAGGEPFVVTTPAGEAQAVGTRFVVETESVQADRVHSQPPQGDAKMGSKLNQVKFLTQVLVLAGIVHLVNAESQVEGRAGEVIKTEAAQPQPPQTIEVQVFGGGDAQGGVVFQAGEKVQVQPLVGQPIVVQGGGGMGWGQAWGGGMYLPGYWQLQNEQTRKEIELVPDQEEKLKEISKQYQEKLKGRQEALQKLYAPLQNKDLSQEERTKLYKEMSEKAKESYKEYQDDAKWATEEVKKVLLPHQVQALEKSELRTRATWYLQSPWMLDRMDLTEEQKEKIKKNRAELAKKVHELEAASFEEVLKVLTPEQVEKFKQPQGFMAQPGPRIPGAKVEPAPKK